MLPYPSMDFVPFDILTAEELDHMVANIESLSDGTGIEAGAITTSKIRNPYKFSAYKTTNQSIGNTQTQVTFNAESYDTGSNFASNAFTATIAGFYHFDAAIQVTATASLSATYTQFKVNGSTVKEVGAAASASINTGAHITADLPLAATDVVTFSCAGNVAFTCNGGQPYLNYFNGHLISAT